MSDYIRVNAPGGHEFLPCGPDHGDTPKTRVQNQRIEAQAGHYSFPNGGSGDGPSQDVNGPLANAFDPATSTAQRQLMAIAEHHPSEVYKANRGVLSMSKSQLHDFAATKGLKK